MLYAHGADVGIRGEGATLAQAFAAAARALTAAVCEPAIVAARERVAIRCEAAEVKGATYTDLRVSQSGPGRWLVQCVVDV